jgi:hypothetical protein
MSGYDDQQSGGYGGDAGDTGRGQSGGENKIPDTALSFQHSY